MTRRVRAVATPAVALLVALAVAGCDAADRIAPPPPSNVEVDTPQLRQVKAEAGIEPCVPGSATDGGLPDVTLACLGGGESVDLATLQGPLVLNFWQAGCEPCRAEMPALQQFHERYGDQVPIIGVDSNDVFPGAALELARDTGVTYPLLADPGGELQGTTLRVPGLPTFFFLSADGELTSASGGLDSVNEVVAMVESHLGITL